MDVMANLLSPEAHPRSDTAHPMGYGYSDRKEPGCEDGTLTLVSVGTLVVWLFCAGVGVWGLLVGYGRPVHSATALPPVQVQVLNVDLRRDPEPVPEQTAPQTAPLPAQPPALVVTPFNRAAPAMMSLVEPTPAVAFAVPVESSVNSETGVLSAASQEGSPSGDRLGSPVAPETLTFGQGDGRQPPPEYPVRALRARQEGVVGLRFNVDPEGHVLDVDVEAPCPWPLLNTAASRVIREKWHFRAGPPRQYRVALHFQLEN